MEEISLVTLTPNRPRSSYTGLINATQWMFDSDKGEREIYIYI